MGFAAWLRVLSLLIAMHAAVLAQVIEFESNGLKYQTLTRNDLTIMIAQLPSNVRDYSVIQVAISNGGTTAQVVRPEDFIFIRDDGATVAATPARIVVDSLIDRASRGDVIKLITTYEGGIYGNSRYRGTNGYELRRQSALAEFTSTRVRAAAAASAIALVQTKLAPGQSTDGAVFYPNGGRGLGSGTIRVQAAGSLFEFPLVSSVTIP
jgi:hypothetical protein